VSKYSEKVISSWGLRPELKELHEMVNMFIPMIGKCKPSQPYLERLRRVQNVAYDIFNNGLGNYTYWGDDHFAYDIGENIKIPAFFKSNGLDFDRAEVWIEPRVTAALLHAAVEVGVIKFNEKCLDRSVLPKKRAKKVNKDTEYCRGVDLNKPKIVR